MAKNKRLIRIGDIVQITNPEFFVRVRYEKDFMDFYAEATMQHDQIAKKMMMQFINPTYRPLFEDILAYPNTVAEHRLYDHIIRGIAAYNLELSKKDRNKRFIETTRMPCYADRLLLVHDQFMAITGEYEKGSGGYDDYTGEYDYTPSRLVKRKYHRILKCTGWWELRDDQYPVKLDIEECHVKFVETKRPFDVPPPAEKKEDLDWSELENPLLIGYDPANAGEDRSIYTQNPTNAFLGEL